MPPPSRAGAFKLETAPSSFEKAAKITYSPAERRTFREGMEKVSAAAFRLKLERFKAGKRRQDGNPSRAGLCFRQPEWIPGKASGLGANTGEPPGAAPQPIPGVRGGGSPGHGEGGRAPPFPASRLLTWLPGAQGKGDEAGRTDGHPVGCTEPSCKSQATALRTKCTPRLRTALGTWCVLGTFL